MLHQVYSEWVDTYWTESLAWELEESGQSLQTVLLLLPLGWKQWTLKSWVPVRSPQEVPQQPHEGEQVVLLLILQIQFGSQMRSYHSEVESYNIICSSAR